MVMGYGHGLLLLKGPRPGIAMLYVSMLCVTFFFLFACKRRRRRRRGRRRSMDYSWNSLLIVLSSIDFFAIASISFMVLACQWQETP